MSDWRDWDGELDVRKLEKKREQLTKATAPAAVPKRKLSSRKSKSSSGYGSVPEQHDSENSSGIGTSVSSSGSSSGSSSSSSSSRTLAENFEDIPYDVIPDYDSHVKRPLSFAIIREQLQTHQYVSLYGFVRDVYEMLNNGRAITAPGSTVSGLC